LLVEFLQQEGFEVDTINAIFKPNICQGIAKKKLKQFSVESADFSLLLHPPPETGIQPVSSRLVKDSGRSAAR
jgi:hypothetical protein